MIIKFDSFNRYEIPTVTLCNPNDSQIGMVDNITKFELTPNFNEISEISCVVSKYLGDIKSETYDKIKKRRQFLVENFGYFIITNVDEENVGTKEAVKNVKLLSCEFELDGIEMSYIDGTYGFNDLMDIVKSLIPHWTLDTATIPSSISAKNRTFEDIDTNIYNFLMTSVQESYGCFFDFDIENRAIKVYDKNDYIIHTDILLTNEDVVNSIKCNENTDDMYTAISPTGGNDLNIAYVNPLGTNTIYNFSYYKNTEWMSQDLVDAVTAWENLFQVNESAFSALITNLLTKHDELISIQTDVTMTKNELDNAKKIKSTTIAENGSLTNINSIIASKQTEHDGFVALLNAKQDEIDDLEENKLTISKSLSFSQNFTSEQYKVLCKYISCCKYNDENITKGTNMTRAEEIQQALELYNSSKELLEKISEPNYEFDVDTESFIFSKEFEKYTEQLATGSLINVQLGEDDIASLILLSMPIDFMDGTVSFKFGNRFKLSNQTTLWDDLQNRVAKTAHTVEKLKGRWDYPVKSKTVNEMQEFMNGTLDLTKNAIVAEKDQKPIMDNSGIHVQKVVDGVVNPKELTLTNGAIAFTDNNWETAKLALGSIMLPDGSMDYGLIAKYLLGEIIAGNQLTIRSSNGDFIIDKDGVRSTVFDTITNVDNKLTNKLTEAKTYTDSVKEDLQSQIDGSITTWFYEYEPTESNFPASDWLSEAEKNRHLGDLFYDTLLGYCYRWQLSNSVYNWIKITDTDVTKALADAAKAQDTADKKRRVFSVEPYAPYDQGDLWSDNISGDLKICIASRASGSFDADEWVLATKYTDDTVANAALLELDNIASDNKLTPSEKLSLKTTYDSMISEFQLLYDEASSAGITTEKSNYITSYNTFRSYAYTLLLDLTTTSDVDGGLFRDYYADYISKRTILQNKLTDTKVSSAMVQTKSDITMTFINGKLSGQTQFTSKGMEVDADGTEGSGINVYNGGIKVYAESKVDVSGETEPVFSVDEYGGVNVIGEISGSVQILNPIDDVLANSNFKLGIDHELGWSEELYNAADIYLTGLHLNSGGMFLGDKIATYSDMGDGEYENHVYRGNVIETLTNLGINAISQNGSIDINAKGGVSIAAGDYNEEGRTELVLNGYGAWLNGVPVMPDVTRVWSGSLAHSSCPVTLTDLEADLNDFRGFYLAFNGAGTRLFCPRISSGDSWLRGMGGYSLDTLRHRIYFFNAQVVNGNDLNVQSIVLFRSESDSIGQTLVSIWGVR